MKSQQSMDELFRQTLQRYPAPVPRAALADDIMRGVRSYESARPRRSQLTSRMLEIAVWIAVAIGSWWVLRPLPLPTWTPASLSPPMALLIPCLGALLVWSRPIRQWFAAACVALLSVTSIAQANSMDEELVRDVPYQIARAWGEGNGTKLAAAYAADGVLVAGHGVILDGPANIARYHDEQFTSALKGSRLAIELTSVRFLKPDVAVIQTRGGILWSGQTQLAPGNRGIQSFVIVKEAGVWRVKLFQNTRILEQAPE